MLITMVDNFRFLNKGKKAKAKHNTAYKQIEERRPTIPKGWNILHGF